MSGLRPYPEYSDSGLLWCGMVPKHWSMVRAKWLYKQMARPVRESDEVVTCFRDGIVTLRNKRRTLGFTNSLKEIGYQGIRKGDLVIHGMDAFAGAVGVSDSDGKCTPVYAICTPKVELDNRYYAYVLREMARASWILALARGIRERSTDFRFETFGRQSMPVPLFDEQKAIANYLDEMTIIIRRFIRNRRQLIKLLNEQKQTFINQNVIGRIDPCTGQPYLCYKPSGIDWLGDIPADWEVKRGKYLFREVDSRSITGKETHLSMSQRHGLVRSSEITGRRLMSESYVGGKLCEKDDLVLNRLKAHLGVFALAPEPGLISPDYTVFRAKRQLCPSFYEYFYRTPLCRTELRKRAKGIVQGFWRLYTDDFYDIPVPVPNVDEQRRIVEALAVDLVQIDTAIDKAYREIDLTHEYSMRLIADVVTGKLEVCHLAPAELSLANEAVDEDMAEGISDDEMQTDDESEIVTEAADADD